MSAICASVFRGALALSVLCATANFATAQAPPRAAAPTAPRIPLPVEADGRLRIRYGEEYMILPRGLQPSMLYTRAGTIVVQGQVPEKPHPSDRMAYPYALETVVSRDGGKTWVDFPRKPGENGINLEGGAIELKNGQILALDTYITPDQKEMGAVGQLFTSSDDWKTLEGPHEIAFEIPDADFYGSTDDGGRPYKAQRLHRRILELPNGDLVTTVYGILRGDKTPSTYMPRMMKTRTMLVRSSDRGRHWKYISTVAVDPSVGTEGFGEAVLCRISQGPKAGRFLCFMRTGRELYQATSDDDGKTWTPPKPIEFAGIDVRRTELWVDWLRDFKDFKGKPLDESNPDQLQGAVVDPDLLELRSGLLVAAFGVRVPQKLCWQHPEHPWNGNYLAFSHDHGETWTTVVRMTSGILTTHYMAIEESPTDNTFFVAYDLGGWSKGMNRDIFGRSVTVSLQSPGSGPGR
jgi:hypothetical protein